MSCSVLLGEAAKYILRTEFGDNWKENVKVIFAGDDTTDEDAMKVNICTTRVLCKRAKLRQFIYTQFQRTVPSIEQKRNQFTAKKNLI